MEQAAKDEAESLKNKAKADKKVADKKYRETKKEVTELC